MTWNIDASHSTVEFSVRHLMISTVKGRFSAFSGTIEFDANNHTVASVDATIDVNSIDTHDEKRDGHLKSPDFFDAATYPTITFKSTKVEKVSDDEFKVTGNLTLHGITKETTLNVTHLGQAKSPFGFTAIGFNASTSINRKDFDLNWNVALEAGGVMVGEKVNISLDVEAIEQVPAAV